MNIITVGIDLAKNVFAVHGINDNGTSSQELARGLVLTQQFLQCANEKTFSTASLKLKPQVKVRFSYDAHHTLSMKPRDG